MHYPTLPMHRHTLCAHIVFIGSPELRREPVGIRSQDKGVACWGEEELRMQG